LPQFGAQGKHDVEHDADPGQILGGEFAAGLIGVDDAIGGGKALARQVMVGDQGGDAQFPSPGHAFEAGDAVIHGDDQIRLALGGEVHDGRREAIAQGETVRHQVVHRGAATGGQQAQGADAEGAGGGAVAVVVGHDQHPGVGFQGIGKQDRGFVGAHQGGGGSRDFSS